MKKNEVRLSGAVFHLRTVPYYSVMQVFNYKLNNVD